KTGVDSSEDVLVLAPISDEPEPLRWDDARPAGVALSDLERDPQKGAAFETPASAASDPKSWERFGSDFAAWLFRTRRLDLLRSPAAAEMSKPGESERDFRARLQQKAREQRDAGADELRGRYAARIAALEERKRRAEQAVDREKQQATSQGLQTAISIGATVLGALLGRKAISATNIGRATTAARGAGRTVQQAGDIARAKENVAAIDEQIAALNAELQAELDQRAAAADPLSEKLETVTVRPKKSDVSVRSVSLAWAPFRGEGAKSEPAWG
ncbi:MAG TPA: ATP-binding protein, partial [Thermoanaerobaculia bacterium]